MKKCSFLFCYFKNLIVLAVHNSCKIYTNNRFCSLRNSFSHLLRIHFIGIWQSIHKDRHSPCMANCTTGCCVSICSCDHFISRTDSHCTKYHFHTCCCRVQTDCPFCSNIFCNLFFKFLGPWSGCDPSASQSSGDFLYFFLFNVRRRKRYIYLVAHHLPRCPFSQFFIVRFLNPKMFLRLLLQQLLSESLPLNSDPAV